MENLWSITWKILVGLGSFGGIIWFVVKQIANYLSEKLSQKYAHQLSQELEKYKSELDKRLYVSQRRFELELSIYREFMSGLVEMTNSAYSLFPRMDELPADQEQQKNIFQYRGNKAAEDFNRASSVIFKNAPFVDRNIYENAKELRFMCLEQIQCFKSFKLDADAVLNRKDLPKEHRECFKRSSCIMEKRDLLIEVIREYLINLENICIREKN